MDVELLDFQIVDRIPPVNGTVLSRLRRFLARQGYHFRCTLALRRLRIPPPLGMLVRYPGQMVS